MSANYEGTHPYSRFSIYSKWGDWYTSGYLKRCWDSCSALPRIVWGSNKHCRAFWGILTELQSVFRCARQKSKLICKILSEDVSCSALGRMRMESITCLLPHDLFPWPLLLLGRRDMQKGARTAMIYSWDRRQFDRMWDAVSHGSIVFRARLHFKARTNCICKVDNTI